MSGLVEFCVVQVMWSNHSVVVKFVAIDTGNHILEQLHFFLKIGAAREAELRRLRKINTEFEEQNTILKKHTESMSCAKDRLEQELALEERQTLALQQQLQSVRQALTASFASLPIPGTAGKTQSG